MIYDLPAIRLALHIGKCPLDDGTKGSILL